MEMKGGGLVSATAVSTPNLVVITEAVVARVVEKDQPSFIGEFIDARRTWWRVVVNLVGVWNNSQNSWCKYVYSAMILTARLIPYKLIDSVDC